MSPPGASRHVIILGMDTFAKKNIAQIREMEREGWSFSVVTNDQRSSSRAVFDGENFPRSRLYLSAGSPLARLKLAWRLLQREGTHHVELYAAGRMTPFYLLLLKMRRLPVLVVERGDIDCLGVYPPALRGSLIAAYKAADAILYKETYMEERLRAMSRAPLLFVPNAVAERHVVNGFDQRAIDFLWVNRIVPQRKPEWLLRSVASNSLKHCSLTFLGLENRANLPAHLSELQRDIGRHNQAGVELLEFTDPEPYYSKARFFCLPSSVVFGNNSLLEAMASGVVPIVTEAPGVDHIVQDGINGIVTAFDEDSYRRGLERAASLTGEQWKAKSQRAIAKVRDDYSLRRWTARMSEAYATVAQVKERDRRDQPS
jgi:glycosyltransferase involved in cell wall biosynthesis